jgi:serine phosphatase RsbU (regulator of sigma subunit)/ligand-binding sensor domain-containing protein
MQKLILLVFTFLMFFHYSFSQYNRYGEPFIKNYSIKDYDAYSQNWATVQDQSGLLYFANNLGVIQFDGTNWNLIKINKAAMVRSLAIDSNGIVYVGAENEFGYISPDNQGRMHYYSLSDSLNSSEQDFSIIEKIYVTDSTILFCAFKKIFKYHKGTLKSIELPKGGFYSLKVRNEFYMGEYFQGLMKLKGNSFIPSNGGEFYKGKDIFLILPYQKNKVLIGTRINGLFIYNTVTGKSIQPVNDNYNELHNYLKDHILYGGLKNKNSYIINTLYGGIIKIDSSFKIQEIYNKASGLQDEIVLGAFHEKNSDNRQLLWCALNNGISKIEFNSAFRKIKKNTGLENEILDIISYKNEMYFASINGVYKYEIKGQKPKTKLIENTEGEYWSFLIINDKLLIGGAYNITIIQNNSIKTFVTDNMVYKLLYSKTHDKIFVGVGDGLYVYSLNNNQLIKHHKIKGITQRIYDIIEDDNGNIWLTTGSNALIKLQFNTKDTLINFYNNKKGLPTTESLYAFKWNENIFLSTKYKTFQYNQEMDSIIESNTLDSVIQATIVYIDGFKKKKNNLWLISNKKGYNEVKHIRKNPDQTFTDLSTPFSRLPECVINTIYPDDEGVLWIATSEGLFTYNPKTKVSYDDTFNTLIRRVYIGEDSILHHGNRLVNEEQIIPILDYKNNGLTFHYSATSYIEESANEYSYFLEGFNETANEWSKWSTETKKEYTNLREGKYTFKVKARNIYDTKSSIATYSFQITPPWYRTFFAYLSYFILLIILIYIIVKLNIRRLQADKERLEGIVKKRTAEIRRQRDQIEKQHDEITASIKYAKRIQRALLPPDELLFSRLPNHFVLFKPRDVVSGDFYWMKQEGDLTLITAADCTGHGVPGAFMSMLGMAFLNEIVKNGGVLTAGRILTQLRDKVKTSLRQTGKEGEAKDGMDIAFCVIDKKTRKLQYAGAYNPLFLIRDKNKPAPEKMDCIRTVSSETHTLYEVKADKMPIGIHISEKENFTNFQLDLLENDTLYMFSDGYADQIGGPKNRKFMSKHFKQLLLDIQHEPMDQQKRSLNLTIENWKGSLEQVDDIVLIGIRV